MIVDTLKERVLAYEDVSEFKLTRKLPVVINLNGRGFRKTTSVLHKPYSEEFVEIMGQTLIRLASEIEGAIFLYSFNDEISIICRNDQHLDSEPWYDNNIQKIISASASIASIAIFSAAQKQNIKLLGEPVFLGKAFIVPSFTEVINYLISKQHQASHTAISMACFYELLKKYNSEKVLRITKNLTIDEKYDLLMKECDVDLQSYALPFWRGIACYRANNNEQEITRKKLFINTELPFFAKNQEFLHKILRQ